MLDNIKSNFLCVLLLLSFATGCKYHKPADNNNDNGCFYSLDSNVILYVCLDCKGVDKNFAIAVDLNTMVVLGNSPDYKEEFFLYTRNKDSIFIYMQANFYDTFKINAVIIPLHDSTYLWRLKSVSDSNWKNSFPDSVLLVHSQCR